MKNKLLSKILGGAMFVVEKGSNKKALKEHERIAEENRQAFNKAWEEEYGSQIDNYLEEDKL